MRRTRNTPRKLGHEREALTYAREQAGLTKQQLADRVGCARSLISELELGTRSATPGMLNALASALNCPRVVLEAKREPEAKAPRDDRLSEQGVRREDRPAGRSATEEVLEVPDAALTDGAA